MPEHIYPKQIQGKVYYYLQKTWREKVERGREGKTRGSGGSRVRTRSIYLGTAESIWKRLQETHKPVEVDHREFGFVAAVYHTAVEIGLVDLLKEHIPGMRYGLERWLYFLLSIINRLQHSTSKEQMGKWAASTVLPDLLGFDPDRLNSQTFWYATDDIISEKELQRTREENQQMDDDIFVGLNDQVFRTIEENLFLNLKTLLNISWDILLYDTTNFFTFIENPAPSNLARTGHSKDHQHHLKQVGLAMCVEKEWGIPIFHRIYRGNSQDCKTFAGVINDLINQVRNGLGAVDRLVLVLDKGNNSEDNFACLNGRIIWVGSLVLSHYADLVNLPLTDYEGIWEDSVYHRLIRQQVMGVDCALVLIYNAKLARKQRLSFQKSIEKIKQQVREKWASYKRRPTSVRSGILSILKQSRYGKYIRVECRDGQPYFYYSSIYYEKIKYFGKNLYFSNDFEAENGWIITQYHSKYKVEDGFKVLKDPELVRWRPTRHWTDTKIRAYGFCCIMSLLLIRVMQIKASQNGLQMSPAVLKEELMDLREIIMIYNENTAETQISRRSSVQQRLWDIFDLTSIEMRLRD